MKKWLHNSIHPVFFRVRMTSELVSALILIALLLNLSACAPGLKMTVVHMNDSHSHVEEVTIAPVIDGRKTVIPAGGLARLGTKIAQLRSGKDNVIFLHAGDAVQGTLHFTRYNGEPEYDWLNWMRCDAMVTGNHEYDKGAAVLAALVDRAQFPMLAANVDITAEPLLTGKLLPNTVLDVGDSRIGIIGLVSPDTPDTSNPEDTIVFRDTAETAADEVAELQRQGIDKIIVLSHNGYERDLELGRTVSGIDVIVGGHTHTLLAESDPLVPGIEGVYPAVVTGPDGNPVYVVQAWAHTRALGVLDVDFDRRGHVNRCSGGIVIPVGDAFLQKNPNGVYGPVDPETRNTILAAIENSPLIEIVPEDPAITEMLQPYVDGIADLKRQVIGPVESDLLHIRVPGTRHETTGEIMEHGSELAPVVADALFWKADQLGLKPDIAIQNGGGVRMDLDAGDLTVGTVYELMPFENTLFVLEIKGAAIRECLESLMERILVPDNDGAFPYASRLRYTADMNRPKHSRITALDVQDSDGSWAPIDPDRIYRIATNQYLADGRDGYGKFKTDAGYRYDTGFLDAEILMEYVEQTGPLTRLTEERITFTPLAQ